MESSLRYEVRGDGVGLVLINVRDSAQNVVRPALAEELDAVLARIEQEAPEGVVFASDKPSSFIAGADIEILRQAKDAEEVAEVSRRMQAAFQRLARCPVPCVAAIDGPCLGGGLELALACRARVATSEPRTQLGLPELQLGVIPGAGGTQMLSPLVGIELALDLLLSSRSLDAQRALEVGLVDEVVPASILVPVACTLARNLVRPKNASISVADRLGELAHSLHLRQLALAKTPLGRNFVFGQAEKEIRKKAQGHYPAPLHLLDVVRIGLERGLEAGLDAEAMAFGQLVQTDVARRLIEVFFARNALKKDSGVANPDIRPRPLRQVGILGAGLMGRGVAEVTAMDAGLPLRLKDRDDVTLASGIRSIHGWIDEQVAKKKVSPIEGERAALRVAPTLRSDAFAACDLLVEAVFEDLDLKRRVLAEFESVASETAIFASNTSSIPISKIAAEARHPSRVVGMHYFSPVPKMPLLEVIRTEASSDEAVATAVRLGQLQKKTVIVVRDGVGFYTSRVLAPYLNEAARMVAEGVPVERIDRVAKELGFPVGPVTLLDEVGIDTAARVAKFTESAFGSRMAAPAGFEALVADGRTGRKAGRGFYTYGGRTKGVDPEAYRVLGIEPDRRARHDDDALRDRLLVVMVLEAIRCWDEGVVRSARDADIGAIFGLGFPAYTGGPLRFVDSIGPSELMRRVRALHDQHGDRFAPPNRLEDMAQHGHRFHGD